MFCLSLSENYLILKKTIQKFKDIRNPKEQNI